MKTSQINYNVRPEKIEEHLSLIKQVFHELERNNVKGVAYSCYQTDEFTFMHIAQFANETAREAFTRLPAFQSFSKNSEERILDKPVTNNVIEIGHFHSKSK